MAVVVNIGVFKAISVILRTLKDYFYLCETSYFPFYIISEWILDYKLSKKDD